MLDLMSRPFLLQVFHRLILLLGCLASISHSVTQAQTTDVNFKDQIAPLIQKYCSSCHNEETRESGIRVDHLDDSLPEESLRLWEAIEHQVQSGKMPPEDEPQPTDAQRAVFRDWLARSLHQARSRPTARNGSMRRLTVGQYDQTLKDLLKIQRKLTDTLPPDAVSKDGFTNQSASLVMNPMQLEAYFKIAEEALDNALVNPDTPPKIQYFRMDLGRSIHPNPSKESLILGANNHLLANSDFIVTEPDLTKDFPFEPFRMQRKFRFIEGYQGNDTVRGWRDFEGIEHAVFACMRGNEGYPKGKAYEILPSGLALRPAIPSPEIFGESSTYGPQANFKLSLRELPQRGRFQVRVKASKANDLFLLDAANSNWKLRNPASATLSWKTTLDGSKSHSVQIPDDGVYLIQFHNQQPQAQSLVADASKLDSGLVGFWPMEPTADSNPLENSLELQGQAKWVPSPFGQALSVSGQPSALVPSPQSEVAVGTGEFTVAAWIHPEKLTQAGIVCLGGYGYTHGWLFDMPDQNGILRIETADANGQPNGTVQSPPGVLRKNQWQHVCAVVRRGQQLTELFVNGYHVASGTIQDADLTNPKARLHIGRIQNAQGFHGQIDDVRIYKRALDPAEIQALVEPGKVLAKAPEFAASSNRELRLRLTNPTSPSTDDRQVTGQLNEPSFCLARLTEGVWNIEVNYDSPVALDRIEFHRVDDQPDNPIDSFVRFQATNPKLGVHIGLRRDCGSTLTQVGATQIVKGNDPEVYIFEGDIANFPAPEVEPDNVNYLAGIREIGVRHEFTDGRETPRLLIHSVEFEGPYYDTWPPESHRSVYLDRNDTESDKQYAIRILKDFARRAFRRPLSDSEMKEITSVFASELEAGNTWETSVRETLLVILTSPQFLYLTETSQGPQSEALDSWELASKLSYFLWNGPPDEQLLTLAGNGELRNHLDSQIDRLVQDPRSDYFFERFVSEWLSLDKFDVVEVDAKRFPHLTRDARKQLRQEPVEFFKFMLSANAPASDLIASKYIVANEVVASYYGLGNRSESGFDFVPIEHQSPDLGGLLTQAAPLSGLSDGREANPVKRGAWFARKIIAQPPEDPPPNVPKLEDLTELSLREKLQRHRDVRGCAQCHAGIDPWGLPFEAFDASGLRRRDNVDSAAKLASGQEIKDFHEFREYLVENQLHQVAFSLAKHLAIYASGRALTYNETQWIRENIKQLEPSGYRVGDMVRWIIHSDLFDKK